MHVKTHLAINQLVTILILLAVFHFHDLFQINNPAKTKKIKLFS